MESNPNHIAIVMDGNRRWAKERGLSAKEGHKAGADNLEKLAYFCNSINLKYLTVYAFSTENWKRAEEEVSALMLLLRTYLDTFSKKASTDNIVIKVLGDMSALAKDLQKSINKAIERTKDNTGLIVNIALNYGGRAEIIHACKEIAQKVKNNEINVEDINEELISQNIYTKNQPDPDLLIRTGGEQRISGFLTWQSTYSEFYFSDKYWPDFQGEDLLMAIEEYKNRNRRLGK